MSVAPKFTLKMMTACPPLIFGPAGTIDYPFSSSREFATTVAVVLQSTADRSLPLTPAFLRCKIPCAIVHCYNPSPHSFLLQKEPRAVVTSAAALPHVRISSFSEVNFFFQLFSMSFYLVVMSINDSSMANF